MPYNVPLTYEEREYIAGLFHRRLRAELSKNHFTELKCSERKPTVPINWPIYPLDPLDRKPHIDVLTTTQRDIKYGVQFAFIDDEIHQIERSATSAAVGLRISFTGQSLETVYGQNWCGSDVPAIIENGLALHYVYDYDGRHVLRFCVVVKEPMRCANCNSFVSNDPVLARYNDLLQSVRAVGACTWHYNPHPDCRWCKLEEAARKAGLM